MNAWLSVLLVYGFMAFIYLLIKESNQQPQQPMPKNDIIDDFVLWSEVNNEDMFDLK